MEKYGPPPTSIVDLEDKIPRYTFIFPHIHLSRPKIMASENRSSRKLHLPCVYKDEHTFKTIELYTKLYRYFCYSRETRPF